MLPHREFSLVALVYGHCEFCNPNSQYPVGLGGKTDEGDDGDAVSPMHWLPVDGERIVWLYSHLRAPQFSTILT